VSRSGLILTNVAFEAIRDLAAGWLVMYGLQNVGVSVGYWRCTVMTVAFALAARLVTFKPKDTK
jgi:hypothetical protein